MDLFNNKQDTVEVLDKWSSILPYKDIELAAKLSNKAKDLRKANTIYPEQEDIFKVFKFMSPTTTKVIILGQDPYHSGNATGAAFACKETISPSLKQIWNSIKIDTNKEYEGKVNPNLQHLLDQGVFLLNTILSVEKGKALSHKYIGWERFTASVIYNLNRTRSNLVFMFWGSYAQKFKKYIDIDKNLLLMDTHPQYANYQNKAWNCNHFSKCNEYLKENNIETIKWR